MSEEKLKGRFVKVANSDGSLNFGESFWIVTIGDRTLFKKTVNNYFAIDSSLSYFDIASLDFGKALLRQTRRLKAFW